MPVDASIPLSVAMPQSPDLLGNYGKALEIQGMQQQNQARQMQMQQQQDEAEAFRGADFSTPEGRNQVLVSVMAKAPQAGIALMKQFGDLDKSAAQAKHYMAQADLDHLKVNQGKQQALASAAVPAWNAYQKALSEGKPDMVARAEADKLMPSALSSLQDSGQFSADEVAAMPRSFDPVKVGGALMSTGLYGKMIEDRLHEAQAGSAEATTALRKEQAANPEKFHQAKDHKQVVQTDEGLGVVDEDNPGAGITAIPGSKGAHKPGTGGNAAAQKANVRAASVAAASKNSLRIMDQIQKEFGDSATTSPLYGQEAHGPIGNMVEAVEKKFVPNDKLKLDADANSLIDEAGPAFTGGLRVNSSFRTYLMSQLPKVGDPAEVAQRKWKNFRENISGASDTFRKAYSGNPDYWAKGDNPQVDNAPADTATPNKPMARPKEGDVVSGYKYLGGDPNSQASWQKVGG